jgi:hypothetical protein
MTEQTANRVANVVLGAAALSAAYIVLRNPSLRRLAIGLAASVALGRAPEWLRREVQDAWIASGRGNWSARSAIS